MVANNKRIISSEEWLNFSREEQLSFTGIVDNTVVYLKNGVRHNLDGPAIIWPDGTEHYYIHDLYYTKQQWLQLKDFISYKQLR